MENLKTILRENYGRMAAEESNHRKIVMTRQEIVALAERELQAGNTIAAYILDLDRALTRALLAEESANHRANVAQDERNALAHQRNDYEFMLARISEALDGVRYQGSLAAKISALRAELEATHSDLADAGGKLEIVGYTTQADINKAKSSALQGGEFYAVPDGDQPIELLRRVL